MPLLLKSLVCKFGTGCELSFIFPYFIHSSLGYRLICFNTYVISNSKHGASLDNGTKITAEYIDKILDEETKKVKGVPEGQLETARKYMSAQVSLYFLSFLSLYLSSPLLYSSSSSFCPISVLVYLSLLPSIPPSHFAAFSFSLSLSLCLLVTLSPSTPSLSCPFLVLLYPALSYALTIQLKRYLLMCFIDCIGPFTSTIRLLDK